MIQRVPLSTYWLKGWLSPTITPSDITKTMHRKNTTIPRLDITWYVLRGTSCSKSLPRSSRWICTTLQWNISNYASYWQPPQYYCAKYLCDSCSSSLSPWPLHWKRYIQHRIKSLVYTFLYKLYTDSTGNKIPDKSNWKILHIPSVNKINLWTQATNTNTSLYYIYVSESESCIGPYYWTLHFHHKYASLIQQETILYVTWFLSIIAQIGRWSYWWSWHSQYVLIFNANAI